MSSQRKTDVAKNPLTVLYQVICNAAFEDEHGANQTLYNALMILGAAIHKETAKEINKKITQEEGRYKYAD